MMWVLKINMLCCVAWVLKVSMLHCVVWALKAERMYVKMRSVLWKELKESERAR